MGTSEQPTKRFMDSEVTIDFSDATTHHDRVLLVDGQKFHVISSLLSQFSEFFDTLFNSNFKEKNEETIVLKDITAADFDNFVRALYPTRLQAAGDNLAGLMQLSIRFLCPTVWGLCLQFLKKKDEFTKFSPGELLQWSEGSDSQELKTLIEKDLIERSFLGGKTGLAELAEILILSPNYSPDILKVKVFEQMLQLVNNIDEDKNFSPLEPDNYGGIEQLKNLAVDYLCKMYKRIDKTQVVVGNFLQIALQYNVLQLQKDVEANLVNDFLNKKGLKYLNLAVKYNLQELKDLIADYLSGTNSSELSDEEYQIILNATPEAKDFVLSIIFKRLSC